MLKNLLLGTLVVFVIWTTIYFLMHIFIFDPIYRELTNHWSRMSQLKIEPLLLAAFISATAFTTIYIYLIKNKCLKIAVLYGVLFGIACIGVSMGYYTTYLIMPISIPDFVVLAWVSWIVKGLVSGLALGFIFKAEKR